MGISLTGLPLRLKICTRDGTCLPVNPEQPLIIYGSVVEVQEDQLSSLIDRMNEVASLLTEDEEWSDNFDLAKLRKKGRATRKAGE